MNMFFHEIRSHLRSTIIWSIAMIMFVAMAMIKFDATVAAGDSMDALFDAVPAALKAMLGFGYFDFNLPIGFFGATFVYLLLLGAIHGGMLGASILSSEERDKTSEFLMVRPITRTKVMTAKFFAALLLVVIFNIVVFISSSMIINSYGKGVSYTGDIALLMIGFFVVEVMFLILGFFLSSVLPNSKIAPALTSGILLTTFMFSVLAEMSSFFSFLGYLSPFSCFDPKKLLGLVDFNYWMLSIWIIVSIILLPSAYYLYNRRDLNI